MANNDIHYIRRELDQLQLRMKDFDVRTEYALSNSDTTPPPNDAEWSTEKPAPEEGKFIWARNIMNMGYGDVITEAYCIGDGQEHILSIDVEYLAWNSPYRQDGDGMEDSPYWQTTAPPISSNQYIWTRSVIETTNGTNYTSPVRITGLKGEKGDAGQSIKGEDGKGFDFIYYTTNDANFGIERNRPADDVVRTQNQYDRWCDSPTPVNASHKYIYMSLRTTLPNTDPAEWGHWSIPVLNSSLGEKGEDGEGFEIVFMQTTDESTTPNFRNSNNQDTGISSYNGADRTGKHYQDADYLPAYGNKWWTDNQQGVTSTNKYEWASYRFKVVGNDGNATWGDFNPPKIWARYSEDGESNYIHIRYSTVNNPASSNQISRTPNNTHPYIGTLVDTTDETDSSTMADYDDPTKHSYSWSLFKPREGIDYDGRFLHIKYANYVIFDDEGNVDDYEFTDNDGEDAGAWLGTLFDYVQEDSDDGTAYTWKKIEGNGIDHIEEQYALHTSYSTAPVSGWQSTKPVYVLGKYYWTRSVIHYTDGTSEQSAPMCVTGLDGTGVNNVFYCTDSLSTPSTPTWSDVHDNSSTMSQNYDKWVKDPVPISASHRYIYVSSSTTHAYNNGVKSWTNFSAPALWGRYASDGSSGTDGFGIYRVSTDIPLTNWLNPSVTGGKYRIAKSDVDAEISGSMVVGDHLLRGSYMYDILAISSQNYGLNEGILLKGENGVNGSGYEYAYYTSNSATAPTKPTGNVTDTSGTNKWTKVPVPMTQTYKYMYISYRTITGSTKSAWSNSALWSQFGEKGDTGDRGVDGKGLEHIFYRTNTKKDWENITGNTNPHNWATTGDFQNDDYVKPNTGWTDNAMGVDKDNIYEYCAIRTKKPNNSGVGVWQQFNQPVLQNIYSAPIKSVINYYLATSSTTAPSKTPTTNWATSPTDNKAKMTATNQYLWNYEVIMDIDNNVVNSSNPCMIGRYGQNGSAGKGIDYITEYYAVNNNKEEIPADSSFSTNVITTTTSNRYLWNYEVITFSDSSTPYKSSKRIISTHGATGQNGSDGEDGFGIYRIFSTITINTWSSLDYPTGRYITAKSPIETELGTTLVAGDHIIYGDYMYEVIVVGGTNYGLSDRTELKGDQGETGIDGDNVSPSIILDKNTDNNLATTTVGGISNQIASDYVSSELKSQTITTYSYKFDDGNEHYAYFYKQGRLVTVNYNLMVRDSITTAYTTIFNVPSWAVPVNSIFILNIMAHFNYYRGQITSSGEFKLGSNNPTGGDGTQGVNFAGSVTYLAKDGMDLKEMTLSFPSTTVEQGNVLTARISPPSGVELPTAIPIYYRINGVVYKRMATPIGAGSYADAKLNINLGMDNTSTTTKKYPVSIWYDGGSYDNGYYQGISGEYGQKQATQNITVKKCTSPVITFGKESSYRCWVRVMNSTYAPLRYHDVTISYNGHSFVGNTDGNGYVYFNLENYVGKSVSVTATISNSTRCTAITSTGNITP